MYVHAMRIIIMIVVIVDVNLGNTGDVNEALVY